jgi:alanyl-tRNA synthetase
VSRSSQVGLVSILGEASVGSGSRRIEALVGFEAFRVLSREALMVQQISEALKVPKEDIASKITQTLEQLKTAEKKLAAITLESLRSRIPEILKDAKSVSNFEFLHYSITDSVAVDQVRDLATSLSQALEGKASVVAVTSVIDEKVVLIVATSAKARELGASSGSLVKVASAVLGGGGGGKDNLAQGGGPNVSKLKEAVLAIEQGLKL